MGREWDRLWCIVVCAFLVIFIPSISALEEGDFALVTQADIGAGYPAIWNPIDNDNVLLPGSFITYRTYPNTDCNMLRKFDAFGNIGFTEIVGTTSGDNCEGIFNDNPMIFHYPNPVNVYSLMYFYLYTDSGFSEMAYTQFINPIDGTRQTNAMQTFISAAKKQKQPSVVIYEYPAGNDQFLYAFVGEKPSQPNTVVLTRRSSTSYNVLYSSNAESYKIQFINSEYNNNPNLWLLVSVFGGADPGTKLLRIDPDTTGNPSIELGPISLDPAGRSFEHTIPDNQGGLIYAYDNNKVSRVLSDGTTRFDVDPVGACQTETRLVAGENSIIVFCIETGELKAYKLDYDGNEVEGPFAVGTKNANADDLYHAIRYENDKALVAWSDDTEKIRVASIDASGPLTKEFEEVMSDPTEPAIKIRPKVMLEPNAPRGWLVIWQDERSGQREIYSRLQNPPPVVELNQPTDLDLLTCTDNIQMSYTATDDSGNNMDCEVFFEDSGADVSAHGPVTVPSGGTMNINQDLTAVPNYPKLNNVWTRTFADAPIEGAVYTGDGYVVAGKKNSDDTILIKLRPDSALSWARYYSVMNGLGQVTGLQTADNGDLLLSTKATSSIGKFNRFDFEGIRDSGFGLWLKSVYETIEHSSGNLFAVAEELGDSLIRKTQADSTLINEQNYLGEKFRDIIEKSNGNLIVAGTQLAEEIDPDTLLPVWQVALTSYAEKVIETSDGGLLFVGVEDSSGDYAIMERTDLNGAPDWIWTSEIYSEVFANGIIEVDQGYIMLCTVRINPTDKYDFALFFIDKNGNLILKQEYDYNGNDNYGNDIIRTEGNSFVVAGYDRYYDGLVAHKDARIMKVNIDNSCYNWYVTCEDGDGSTGVSETWEFCMDCLCGNGVVDNGEACDGRSWGSMTGCEDFDEFTGGILDCFNDGPNKCLFNTGSCEPTIAVPVCGDGNIESGETCDFDPATGAIIWDTNVNECGWFDDWTAGTLGCFPEGHEDECHVDTTLCTKGEEVFCDVYTQAVDITAQSIGVAGQTGWFMKEYSNLDYVTVVKGPEKAHLMEGSPSKFIVGLENDWRYYEDDSQEFSVNEKILAADINPSTWIAVGGIDGWKIYDTIGAIRAQGNLETYDIEFTEPWEILVGGPSGWEEWDVLTPQLLASGPEITYSIDSWKQEDPPASNYLIARGGPDGWYGYYKNSGGVQWFCSGPESVNTLAVGAYILISTDTGVYWVTPGACTLNLVSPDSANQLSGLGGDDLYDVTRIGALADDNQFATFNDIGTISSHENQRAVTTSAFSGFPGGNYHLAIGAG
ncbi:MAG: hypothetical protein KKG59_04810 [Nanoarchaeota archaeon]|nr:hypothetical protein [Nanoarchaeota archaeon]